MRHYSLKLICMFQFPTSLYCTLPLRHLIEKTLVLGDIHGPTLECCNHNLAESCDRASSRFLESVQRRTSKETHYSEPHKQRRDAKS